MKPAPVHVQEPDLYTFQRCSIKRASTAADVVESSSDDSSKQSSDDASTHSDESNASTLGPQPCAPTHPQQLQQGIIIDPNTIPSMPFHIVADNNINFVESNEIPELPTSDWETSAAPMEVSSNPMAPKLATPDNKQLLVETMAVFEGRSFQCIDETTLRSMEAVLIAI
jgi:hypothetical protein